MLPSCFPLFPTVSLFSVFFFVISCPYFFFLLHFDLVCLLVCMCFALVSVAVSTRWPHLCCSGNVVLCLVVCDHRACNVRILIPRPLDWWSGCAFIVPRFFWGGGEVLGCYSKVGYHPCRARYTYVPCNDKCYCCCYLSIGVKGKQLTRPFLGLTHVGSLARISQIQEENARVLSLPHATIVVVSLLLY